MGIRNAAQVPGSPLAGALWETLVASELRRRQVHREGGWDFHFWRDRTKEADFLMHRGGTFDLADAKWAEQPSTRDAATLLRVAAELPKDRVRSCTVICRCANPYPLATGVYVVPLAGIDAWLG
jgi:predicted AAA+ superfamily ATPase